MNILDILIKLFVRKQIEVVNTPKINGDGVRKILTPFTTNLWISDGEFKTINRKNLGEFLIGDNISEKKYITERLDCDDFSYMLMGRITEWEPDNAIGIVWGNNTNGDAHAWNFYIGDDEKIWFIEPQNDTIFAPTTEKIWIMIV